MFFLAACSTLLAYIIRLPVSTCCCGLCVEDLRVYADCLDGVIQIPEKALEYSAKKNVNDASRVEAQTTPPDNGEAMEEGGEDGLVERAPGTQARRPRRRLSDVESIDGADLERGTT